MPVNDKFYWDTRFSTNWDSYGGRIQTKFFYQVLLDNLPKDIINEILEETLSICDVGCAEGDGTDLLNSKFNKSIIIGIDFSEESIKKARNYYKNCEFKCEDMLTMSDTYDVIISSNVLEHFSNPYEILNKIVRNAKRYFIMLIPYEEYPRCSEHLFTFNECNIPKEIDIFNISFLKIIDTAILPGSKWNGKQILCIYKN